MSIHVARRKRGALYFSIIGLIVTVAALSFISARDPDGATVRVGMTLVTLGAAMWLPWQALLPAVIAAWLGPNIGRNMVEAYDLFNVNMMVELPGLLLLAAISFITRVSLRDLEQENFLMGMNRDSVGTDPTTGILEESQLRNSLEVELSRSRRFGRSFAFVLVGIDEMRQRFDYRHQSVWDSSFAATAELLKGTRTNVDRVYRYGPAGFALVLPESGPKDVEGLLRRLRRVARKAKPAEGEPGGPLPAHYGATFFPTCATTVDDLIRRAEIAVRVADGAATRVKFDGAEAPEMAPVEMLRLVESGVSREEEDLEPVGPLQTVELELTLVEEPVVESITTPVVSVEEPMKIAEPAAPLLAAAPEAALAQMLKTKPGETNQQRPVNLFAYRAPEPAVDIYNRDWQTEAPLSVVRRPHPKPRIVAIEPENQAAPEAPAMQGVLDDALKQLDDTLQLIRTLKQRSA